MKTILEDLVTIEGLPTYIYDQDTRTAIRLEETDVGAACEYVVLTKKREETLTLNSDKKIKGKGIFDTFPIERPSNQISDYIIFCLKGTTLFVLLIEMKSENTGTWSKQVVNSELLSKHFLEQIEFRNSDNVLGNTEFRSILFSTQDIPPHRTTRKKTLKPPYTTYKDIGNGILGVRKPCNKVYPLGIFLK